MTGRSPPRSLFVRASELDGERTRAGTDLDDEIAARDAGVPDEVSGEARDEEVLTGPGACA